MGVIGDDNRKKADITSVRAAIVTNALLRRKRYPALRLGH